ncbi:hypothetical protein Bca52824_020237 [Brassica carinata]|uniref:Dehydrogenase E1 component domain-containing protein n=1 Tax=Brassica carinata TaxID=52824 RepID=A0A8X7VUM0_BRACI|nr:hypothetical protein Bca52824_020237 [Brassica carinata]
MAISRLSSRSNTISRPSPPPSPVSSQPMPQPRPSQSRPPSLHLPPLRPLPLRRILHPRAPHLLPHHGPDAPHGDRRRLPLQGEADPRLLPPLRRPGGSRHRYGGRDHEERRDRHGVPRPLHLPGTRGSLARCSRSSWGGGRVLGRKGGSMHFYKKDFGVYGGHGIVGAQVPLGCGIAFAQRAAFEALNISALWDLPAILVCENNHYGMGTAEWRAAKSPSYYKRGDYVPGLKVDGMDAFAVKQACKFAKEHALKNGPIILEMDTYRYHGHSMSDPGSTYRTRDEISGVRQVRTRSIERIKKLVLSHDLATEKELKDTEKEIRKEVDDAIAKAKDCPMPEPSELFTNVYVKGFGTESFGADRKKSKPRFHEALVR